jgi:hypothetical protein
MTRDQDWKQPVSDEEFGEVDERIGDHFDRVRSRLNEELDNE